MFKEQFNEAKDETSVLKIIQKILKIKDHGEYDEETGIISVQVDGKNTVTAGQIGQLSKKGITLDSINSDGGDTFLQLKA